LLIFSLARFEPSTHSAPKDFGDTSIDFDLADLPVFTPQTEASDGRKRRERAIADSPTVTDNLRHVVPNDVCRTTHTAKFI
jgi:hypothetical protein